MAPPTALALTSTTNHSDYGSDIEIHTPGASDYGSEFDIEEEIQVGDFLSHLAATTPSEKTLAYLDVGKEDASLPSLVLHRSPASATPPTPRRVERSPSVKVEYDRPLRQSWIVTQEASTPKETPPVANNDGIPALERRNDEGGIRTPLEKFRTKPKKPLSVTDLVSPAWCELQYSYTLSKFGRKPRTEAMKQGSKVHKVLEEQVHKIVPVQTKTKEDRFGLRLWNAIQGLRTLRDTGLTRELEIWGVIDGQIVNGVIDEISYTCPDLEFEEQMEQAKLQKSGGTRPHDQLNIMQSFANAERRTKPWMVASTPGRKIYISDVKTRGAKNLPGAARLKPTWMQLMLYRKLLESLALNTVDAETIFTRYDLQPLVPFSETLMLELGALDNRLENLADEENPFAALVTSEIETHNNLCALWSLMISEYSTTINDISDILRAEFRFSRTGELIGSEVVVYDVNVIDEYIATEMSWWKGEREAKGVEIEDAFKCRACDFAEECTWRKNKVQEATEKHRIRIAERAKSTV